MDNIAVELCNMSRYKILRVDPASSSLVSVYNTYSLI